MERDSQRGPSGAVHECRGDGDQPGSDRDVVQHDAVWVGVAKDAGPAGQVVSEHGAGEPCGVRKVVTGGAVLEPGAFF